MSAIFRYDIKQNTPEWFMAKLATPSASEFDKIITPAGKKVKAKTTATYMARLLWEWTSGYPCQSETPTYQSPWMEHGHEYEETVCKAFALMTGMTPEKIGGVSNWDGLLWASPDRIIKGIACFEAKSPAPWTQILYLIDKPQLSEDYYPQLQGQLFVGELEKQYIASDSHKVNAEPVILEVGRDEDYITKLSLYLREFTDTMLEKRLRLDKEFGLRPPIREAKKLAHDDGGEFGVSMADVDALLGHGN